MTVTQLNTQSGDMMAPMALGGLLDAHADKRAAIRMMTTLICVSDPAPAWHRSQAARPLAVSASAEPTAATAFPARAAVLAAPARCYRRPAGSRSAVSR